MKLDFTAQQINPETAATVPNLCPITPNLAPRYAATTAKEAEPAAITTTASETSLFRCPNMDLSKSMFWQRDLGASRKSRDRFFQSGRW
jgi:hypothetical protein